MIFRESINDLAILCIRGVSIVLVHDVFTLETVMKEWEKFLEYSKKLNAGELRDVIARYIKLSDSAEISTDLMRAVEAKLKEKNWKRFYDPDETLMQAMKEASDAMEGTFLVDVYRDIIVSAVHCDKVYGGMLAREISMLASEYALHKEHGYSWSNYVDDKKMPLRKIQVAIGKILKAAGLRKSSTSKQLGHDQRNRSAWKVAPYDKGLTGEQIADRFERELISHRARQFDEVQSKKSPSRF